MSPTRLSFPRSRMCHYNVSIDRSISSDHSLSSSPSPSPTSSPQNSHHQSVVDLPCFRAASEPNFRWNGGMPGSECVGLIERCYARAVHWIPNLFKVPFGKHGKSFVKELARLFRSFAEDSAMESIALKAALLFPLLLLQKPHRRSKNKDHVHVLERRLKSWHDGCFLDLLKEGKTIQKGFIVRGSSNKKPDLSTSFSHLMYEGKVKAALRLLENQGSGGLLSLSSPCFPDDPSRGTVRDALIRKHPDPSPASPDHCLLTHSPPPPRS